MLVDLHIHTKRYSSRCSLLPPQLLTGRLNELGLDGAAITEHNHLWSRAEVDALKDDSARRIFLVSGKEIECDIGHLLIFGVRGRTPSPASLTEILDFIRPAGGLAIWAHPLRFGRWDSASDEEIVRTARLCHGVEALTPSHTPSENDRMTELVQKHGLTAVGGSDAHTVDAVGRAVTRFHQPLDGLEDLIEAVRNGACSPEKGPAGWD